MNAVWVIAPIFCRNHSRESCEAIEKQVDELARKYVESHDPEIVEELYRVARQLEKMEKESLN
jgi:hypothetical protein